MANIAEGIRKSIFYKKETTFGELPGASGSKSLRRVTGNFNLNKETYQSEEIRTDYQMVDFRHGVRSVEGTLNGELSPKSYSDFFASALARNWTAGVVSASVSLDITSVLGGYVVSRDSGSFVTEGFKVGDVVRLSGANLDPANVSKNLLVTAVAALDLDVIVLNNTALVEETAALVSTVTVVGAKTYAPLTGHTSDSYTFEEWYNDITQSEVFTGNKVNTIGVSLPASGLTTVDFGFMGQDLKQTGTVQYFTSPAPQGTDGIFAAVNGALLVGGEKVALVTGVTLNVNRNLSMEAVVGSNFHPEIFDGRILVDGEFTAFFVDGSFRDIFNNETEVSLVISLTTSNLKDAEFLTFVLPRIKVNSDTKNDGETGIVSTHSFQALLNFADNSFDLTTLAMQDSAVVV
jgi:hypothetical protein